LYIIGMLAIFAVLHKLYINRFKIGINTLYDITRNTNTHSLFTGRWYLKVRGFNFDE